MVVVDGFAGGDAGSRGADSTGILFGGYGEGFD